MPLFAARRARVAGYDGVNMTLFPDITDEQIDGIIEYIKTLQ